MELTFLGTGTSTGVPSLLCQCDTCTSTDPRDKRMRTSALVKADGRNILIDCGPDFRQQALRAGIERIDGVLLTHSHYDHVGGVDDLRAYCRLYGGHLPVYCTADVAEDLRQRVPYCFSQHPYPGVPTFDLRVIDTEPFQVAGIEVLPLPVMHNKPIRGYMIGGMAYVTDCKTMPDDTLRKIHGADTLVLNALRIAPHATHMNLEQALDVISKAAPRQAYLTHLADAMGRHADVAPRLPGNVGIAYDGLTVYSA